MSTLTSTRKYFSILLNNFLIHRDFRAEMFYTEKAAMMSH